MRSTRFSLGALLCFTLVLATLSLPSNAADTSFTQVATLTPSDFTGGTSQFGQQVAIAGNTAVVGAPEADNGAGRVYVFVKPAAGWANMTQTAELSASDSASGINFGMSVSISGNTIVVGSFAHNTAYIFVKPASGWTNMTENARLSAASNTNGISDLFGGEVAINGGTIAVGAYQASFDRGRVDVFTEPKSGWVSAQPTGHIFAPDPKVNGYFGMSLAISGSTIFAAAPGQSEAYVYLKPAAGWKGSHTNGLKLTGSDVSSADFFGLLSTNGSTVVIGAPSQNNTTGAAYVFVEPTSGWTNMSQTAKLTASNGVASDGLGASTAILGQTAIVGAPGNDTPGAIYTFDEPAGGWVNETQTSELAAAGSNNLGISMSGTGTTLLVGARNSGTAYIFTEQ